MIEIRIEGQTDGTTANANIAVDLDPKMEKHHKHYDFEFNIDSLDPKTSMFLYKNKPLFGIKYVSESYRSGYKELNLYNRSVEKSFFTLLRSNVFGTTILPDSKFSKKKNLFTNTIKLRNLSYDKHPFHNGVKYTCTLTDDNNPFLKDVKFNLLPTIISELKPSKYTGINCQTIEVGNRDIIAEAEGSEIVSLNFCKLGIMVEVSHSGDDAFGSTIVRKNGKIEAIHQSKQVGYITWVDDWLTFKTTADGNDEVEYRISNKAEAITDAILKHDDVMKNAMVKTTNEYGYDVNVYYIRGDQSGVKDVKEYFYITDHSSIWALYRADLEVDLQSKERYAKPIKIEYDTTDPEHAYKCTYYNQCGDIMYEKTITERSDYSEYTIKTEDFNVFCKAENDKDLDGHHKKFTATITRNTGGCGFLRSMIERFDAMHEYGSNKYVRALESILKYDHIGENEPIIMCRYLELIEDICKDPHYTMEWSRTFFDTRNNINTMDIDLILNPGDTISWAKLILYLEQRYKVIPDYDELKLLDRISWLDFMIPYDVKYAEAGKSDADTLEHMHKEEFVERHEDDDKVDVDEDEIPTASNSCEAMYMDN